MFWIMFFTLILTSLALLIYEVFFNKKPALSRKKMLMWVRAFRSPAYGLNNKAIRRHLACMKGN